MRTAPDSFQSPTKLAIPKSVREAVIARWWLALHDAIEAMQHDVPGVALEQLRLDFQRHGDPGLLLEGEADRLIAPRPPDALRSPTGSCVGPPVRWFVSCSPHPPGGRHQSRAFR